MLPEFGIWLQDFSKLAIIQKMTTASPFANMTSASIFLTVFVSLVKFSYWPKFHVNTSLVLEKAGERGEEGEGGSHYAVLQVANSPSILIETSCIYCLSKNQKNV